MRFFLALCAGAALLFSVAACSAEPSTESKPASAGKYPAFGLTAGEAQLAQGKKVYETYCIGCHGIQGDGQGPAARFLDPKPRNFKLGQFRFSSRPSGELPTDEDLFRSITEGLRGTSMPAWPLLPEQERRAVIAYLKTFAPEAWSAESSASASTTIADDPYYGQDPADAIKRGRYAYHGMAQCYSCHPAYTGLAGVNEARAQYGMSTLDGMREKARESKIITNEDGSTMMPPDFTWNKLKRGLEPHSLYHVIGNGIGGAAMPTWKGVLPEEDLWGLVYYIRSLAAEAPKLVMDGDLAARRRAVEAMDRENAAEAEKIKQQIELQAAQEAAATENSDSEAGG